MYQAQKHYQALSIASRIEAASPHELVAILYEELLRALDVTRTAMVQGKQETCRAARERCSSILLALEASLDFERGGELARNLANIYRSMQKELSASVQSGKAQGLEAVRGSVAELLAAWARIGVREVA
jgi:flagellar protein FliS